MAPDNLFYRQALRGVECKKYNNNKTGAKMAGMKLIGVRGKVKKARIKKNWDELDRAAEEGLKINPWDAQLNADLAYACEKREFGEVTIEAYKKAVECDPNNPKVMRNLADLLAERGEYDDAVILYQRIFKLNPDDKDARQKIGDLTTKGVLDRGGYEDASSTKDVMADHEVAKRLNKDHAAVADHAGVSEEADLKHAIRKEPDNPDNYVKAGDFYRREGDLSQSVQMLSKAVELSNGDPGIRERFEDVELDLLRQKAGKAKAASEKNPDNESFTKKSAGLQSELQKREIEVLKSRIERHPKDLVLKFELGKRYRLIKKFTPAIKLLQQAIVDVRIAAEAHVLLGMCFMAEKKGSLARRNLEKAVEKIDPNEQAKIFLLSHYWLGRLCEDAGQTVEAEDHYSEVLAIDYEYKDALQRLEKLQGGE
jgi:tetratricopeptide (TPR) repeat protein